MATILAHDDRKSTAAPVGTGRGREQVGVNLWLWMVVRTFVGVGKPEKARERVERLSASGDSLCPVAPVYALSLEKRVLLRADRADVRAARD